MNILQLIAAAKGLSNGQNGKQFVPVVNETSNNTAWIPNNLVGSAVSAAGNGIADFYRGFNENNNNAFSPNNFNQNQFVVTTPADNTKLQDYQKQLKLQKDTNGNQLYSDDVINAVAEGKNSGNKDIAGWINANQDAYPTTQTYDKGLWGKIGEGVGTAYRWSNSPVGKAVISGIASTALTGNPLVGAINATAAGTQRANTAVYDQALKKYGINGGSGFFNDIDAKDMAALSNADYNMARMRYYDDYSRYRDEELARKIAADKVKEEQGNKKLAIQQIKAEKTTAKGGKGSGRTAKTKLADNPQYKSDYDRFVAVMNGNYSESAKAKAKAYMAQMYGTVPKF